MSRTAIPPRLIYPPPRDAQWGDGVLRMGSQASLHVAAGVDADLVSLCQRLWHAFTRETGSLQVVRHDDWAGHRFVLVGEGAPGEGPASPGQGDGYSLTVDDRAAAAAAHDDTGLRHAWLTLMQMLHVASLEPGGECFDITHARIRDGAALAFRGIHLCVFPETSMLLLEKALRLIGMLKFTHVVLEFWGTLKLDALPELAWPGAMDKATARRLIDIAREMGVEPIPMFNSWGHASQSRVAFGRHVVLDQNPRLAPLFEPDGWTWCLANPDTRKLLDEVVRELAAFAGPGGYFHLGCDEAYSHATCDRCRAAGSPAGLLAEHLNRLAETVASLDRRPIIWGDALLDATRWRHPIEATSRADQQTHLALPELSRSFVIADWQYWLKEGDVPSVAYFADAGFDVLACPWDNRDNVRTLAHATRAHRAAGMLVTTWDRLPTQLRELVYAASGAWCEDPGVLEGPAFSPIRFTSTATLLRLLTPVRGRYAQAGWLRHEVTATAVVDAAHGLAIDGLT